MSGAVALVRVRQRELVSTWRGWVLPLVALALAATGPVMTNLRNEILTAALGAGSSLALPEPTALDANAQWTKNLTQLLVLVVIVLAAGAINSEVNSGVAILTLTKPPSRAAYVLTHAATQVGMAGVAVLLGGTVTWLMTWAVFGTANASQVFGASAVWLVLATMLVAASLLASAAIDGVAGAIGVGVGVYFVVTVLGAVPVLAHYSPAGLTAVANAVAAGTQSADGNLWWPVGTGIGMAVALLAGAVAVFRGRAIATAS